MPTEIDVEAEINRDILDLHDVRAAYHYAMLTRIRKIVVRHLTHLQDRFPRRTVWFDDDGFLYGFKLGIDNHQRYGRWIEQHAWRWEVMLRPFIQYVSRDRVNYPLGLIVLPARQPRMSRYTVTLQRIVKEKRWFVQRYEGKPIAQQRYHMGAPKHAGQKSRWVTVRLETKREQHDFDALVERQMRGIQT